MSKLYLSKQNGDYDDFDILTKEDDEELVVAEHVNYVDAMKIIEIYNSFEDKDKNEIEFKQTGIIRRVDDLGRVVIPKEIRRAMKIKEGDPLEVVAVDDGIVCFRKYEPEKEGK